MQLEENCGLMSWSNIRHYYQQIVNTVTRKSRVISRSIAHSSHDTSDKGLGFFNCTEIQELTYQRPYSRSEVILDALYSVYIII